MTPFSYPSLVDRALQVASQAHHAQSRKGTNLPYISHPAMVGFLLQREGFDDAVIAAGILHDVVEDTKVTLDQVKADFGPYVGELVAWLSEQKCDENGARLPWEVRKQAHFEHLQKAPVEAKAIVLADKLHNLTSTLEDARAGRDIWPRFKAPKDRWLWNASRQIDACQGDDPRLQRLVLACRQVLAQLLE